MNNVLPVLGSIFYNPSEHRLRAPWRILIEILLSVSVIGMLSLLAAFLIAFLLLLTFQIPFSALGNGQFILEINAAFSRLPLLLGIRSLVVLVLVGLAFWLLARWIDRRPWRDYGFHFNTVWWRDLGFGLFLGTLLMALIFGVEYLLGWVSVSGTLENGQPQMPFWQLLVSGFLAYILVGFEEELFARGYLIRNLAEGLHLPRINSKTAVLIAYLLTSVFFGFLHGGNANATLVSSLNLSLAGLFLGLGFVLTGELAIPIGLHIAWNFVQGYVFGFPVSGVDHHISLLAMHQSGPAVWTGGAFGPEGGLIGVFAFLLGLLGVYAYVRWTHRRAAVDTDLAEYKPVHPVEPAAAPSLVQDQAAAPHM